MFFGYHRNHSVTRMRKNQIEIFPVEGVHHLTALAVNAMHIDVGNVQSLYTLLEERYHVVITLADTMLLKKVFHVVDECLQLFLGDGHV